MNYEIIFNSAEAKRLSAAAKQVGIAPEELIKRLALDHISEVSTGLGDDLDAKLRRWQSLDEAEIMPDVPAQTLFAAWSKEDELMSDQDRKAEEQLWTEIEQAFVHDRAPLRLRRLG